MTRSIHTKLAILLLCTVPLASCNGYFGTTDDDADGGNGGGSSDAQGIWVGTTSDRFDFHMLLTPNNDVWGISWAENFNQVNKLWKGSGSRNGRTFTANGKNFSAGEGSPVQAATLSGTVASGVSFDGNLGQNVTFTSTFNSQYNDAFDLGSYTGTWAGRDSTGASVSFTIKADGNFDAASNIPGRPDRCTITGALRKATSDKNYATTTLSFGGATNCLSEHAGTSMPGIAIKLTDSSAAVQPLLLIAATNSGQTSAWFAYARKQAQE